jgi:hypothetical protein
VIRPGSKKQSKEFHRFGEEHLIALSTGLVSKGLSEVSFSRTCGAVEKDMLSPFDENTAGQVSDQAGVEFGVERKVKALDRLFFLEGGTAEPEGELSGFPSFDFILDKKLEELEVSET